MEAKAIAKLKDQARIFEQREDWDEAISAYQQVLRAADEDQQVGELPLYNRVGDLYLRAGRPNDAVRYYEQAADRYGEAGLYNNAIALCNKALRYAPHRLDLLMRSRGGKSLTTRAPHVLAQFLRAGEGFAPTPRLREIRCPVLLLTGEKTSALFKDVAAALAREIPQLAAVTVPGQDHANIIHPTPPLLDALQAFFAAHLDVA